MEGTSKDPQRVCTFFYICLTCRQAELHAIYVGFVPTHPRLFAVVAIWESIHSYHKFGHSPAYGLFMAAALPVLDGPLDIKHFDIFLDSKTLKTALESPITGMSILPVKKGKVADFFGFYNEKYWKYVAGDTQ